MIVKYSLRHGTARSPTRRAGLPGPAGIQSDCKDRFPSESPRSEVSHPLIIRRWRTALAYGNATISRDAGASHDDDLFRCCQYIGDEVQLGAVILAHLLDGHGEDHEDGVKKGLSLKKARLTEAEERESMKRLKIR